MPRTHQNKIIGFLLAAGRSLRFGSDKRLHRLPDGRTLMQASLDSISAVCDEVLIAVRHDDSSDIHGTLSLAAKHTIYHTQADNAGMGDSIATLANIVRSRGDEVFAVLVALADMPFLKHETLHTLKQRAIEALGAEHAEADNRLNDVVNDTANEATNHGAREDNLSPTRPLIVCPRFQQERGHPVIFCSSLLNELSACTGDTGARRILERHADRIMLVAVADFGVTKDIDVPATTQLAGPYG